MPPSVIVREAVVADLPVLMDLASEAQTAPAWSLAIWQQVLDSTRQSEPDRLVFVASVEGRVTGFAVLQKVEDEGELENLAVACSFQRKGVATRLCEALFASAGRAGLKRMHLEVREGNTAALALYAKLGFQVEGQRPRYYADPCEDALLLGKAL